MKHSTKSIIKCRLVSLIFWIKIFFFPSLTDGNWWGTRNEMIKSLFSLDTYHFRVSCVRLMSQTQKFHQRTSKSSSQSNIKLSRWIFRRKKMHSPLAQQHKMLEDVPIQFFLFFLWPKKKSPIFSSIHVYNFDPI